MQEISSDSKIFNCFDPRRGLLTPYGLTCVRWQPTLMSKADRHNEIELNLLVSGSLTYRLGGREIILQPNQLTLFWASTPHQIVAYSEHTEFYVATIPLAWFLAWSLPEGLIQSLLRGQLVIDEGELRAGTQDRDRFLGWSKDLSLQQASLTRAVILEMEARLLRLRPLEMKGSRESVSVSVPRLDLIINYLSKNYTRPLTATEVGKEVNLHPNYAMTLFKQAIGITITDYISQLRVAHAQHLLVTTNESVADIASQSGFASLSRFNAVFKQETGNSPSAYRKKS